MLVTVIVCTRNRAASLRRMLNSATALDIPKGLSWEFIVVDNGSTDDTAAAVESYTDKLPIRRVLEPVPGLSNARNRGVDESRGDLIVWTDDDVMVDPGWLSAYVDSARNYPDADFFGGNITPVLEEPVTDLFARNFDSSVLGHLMARRSFPEPSVAMQMESMPYGANFAIRGAIQRRYRFDPCLGVSPLHNRFGEESNLLYEAIADGATGRTVPASNVQHFIPGFRQTRAYIRKYYATAGETWAFGRTQPGYAVATTPLPKGRVHFLGIPTWFWTSALLHGVQAVVARLSSREAAWLQHISQWDERLGIIKFIIRNGRGDGVRSRSNPFAR